MKKARIKENEDAIVRLDGESMDPGMEHKEAVLNASVIILSLYSDGLQRGSVERETTSTNVDLWRGRV